VCGRAEAAGLAGAGGAVRVRAGRGGAQGGHGDGGAQLLAPGRLPPRGAPPPGDARRLLPLPPPRLRRLVLLEPGHAGARRPRALPLTSPNTAPPAAAAL